VERHIVRRTVYVFHRARLLSPIIVATALIGYCVWRREWIGLTGLPLIYLGWVACAPNLNLADGCLPVFVTLVSGTLGFALGVHGLTVAAAACGATWLLASLESASRCRPEVIDTEPSLEDKHGLRHD
jgi:hypothetical protein